jgi:hypothetical protein
MSGPAPTREQKIAFLRRHGAQELGHGARTLLRHLTGTEGLLRQWEARTALCDAGLFHSVYGTESFKGALIPADLRPTVATLIGDDAERIAWLFGALQKESLYAMLDQEEDFTVSHRQTGNAMAVTTGEYRDLCELTVANWLEQRPGVPEEYKRIRETEFRKMRVFLSEPGRMALDEAYAFTDL